MKIRIKHILRCYQSGMSIRSISSSLLISRNTVKRYIRIYEDMGIELERLLKMDEHHLHELFGTGDTQTNQQDLQSISIFKNIYLSTLNDLNPVEQQEGPCMRRLRNRPQGYSYCSFCLYLRREKGGKNTGWTHRSYSW